MTLPLQPKPTRVCAGAWLTHRPRHRPSVRGRTNWASGQGGDQVDASITSTTALDTKIPIPRYQYQDTNTKIPRSVLWEGISLYHYYIIIISLFYHYRNHLRAPQPAKVCWSLYTLPNEPLNHWTTEPNRAFELLLTLFMCLDAYISLSLFDIFFFWEKYEQYE